MDDRHQPSDSLPDPEVALNILQDSLRKRDYEILELDKQIEILKQQNKELPGKKNALEREITSLQRDVETLENEKTVLEKVRSSSRDARKMYGDSTPGDVTHEQVALEYKTFFKDAFRKLPQNIPGADKYQLWEMASTMFTEAYDSCRTEVVQKMLKEIQTVATEDVYLGETNEKTTDICRAYEILADVAKLNKPLDDDEKRELAHQIFLEIRDKVDQSNIDMKDIYDAIDIAWSTVGTVTPAGQQKLLLDYAAKSKGSKPSHTDKYVDEQERRSDGSTHEGRGGVHGGGRDGRGRVEGDVRGRSNYGNYGSQGGRNVPQEEYPAATWANGRRAYVGRCIRCRVTEIYNDSLYKQTSKGSFCTNCLCPSCREPLEINYLFVNNIPYHRECAENCNACGKKFSRSNPWFPSRDKRLLCGPCRNRNYQHSSSAIRS